MSDVNKTASGEPDESNNSPVETPPSNPEGQGGENKVDYSSYMKLLAEKKKTQAELERFREEASKREKEELEQQQKYKELYESTKQKVDELSDENTSFKQKWNDAIKLSAFQDALGDTKRIDHKYSGFIDTSKILIDPETNKVDPVSVKKEVERVLAEYPEIIKSTVTQQLPNERPGGGNPMSYEKWLTLPPNEMRKHLKDVVKS